MKVILGILLVFGSIAAYAWTSVPRLITEVWHARDFVPAQSYAISDYKCTNWNVFMFNDCTVTFVSRQSRESQQFTDWRFGRAPSGPVQLLQRRDDASSVTTDVSLRTLWNRILVALALVGLGAFLTIGLLANAVKDAAIAAPTREPVLEPAGRSTFGKRQAR